MAAPIAVQLYTLRDALAQDFEGVIRKLAQTGFAGVETAGNYGETLKSGAMLFRDLGLRVSSMHSPLPLGDKQNEVLDTAAELDTNTIVLPWHDRQEFQSLEGIQKLADQLNAADEIARANNLRVAYHNHDQELLPLSDGTIPLDHLARLTNPTVLFEVDIYWVKVGGSDPVQLVSQLGKRAPLLHIKDGSAKPGDPMVAAGQGVIDIPGVVAASSGSADWMIVELDNCATDMMTAVEQSYAYLTSNSFAEGSQHGQQ